MATDFFKQPMRVLHLEDNDNDLILVAEMLRVDGLKCELVVAQTRPDFEAALNSQSFDLIISDFSLPSFDGFSALIMARERVPSVPFIFFSGTMGEEIAVETLKKGATDYVLKQRPQRLMAAVRNALKSAVERTRRQRAEEELKKIEEQFLRAQRLENLGMLVTGIAHDLNNMLVPVIVGVELLKTESLSEDAVAMLQTMETSARRSADMVKQMLTFARGGEASKTLIHTDQLVKEMGKIIAETFPKSIQRRILAEKKSHPIFAIPTQIHQVLMNLCVNARDAMPNGGTLTLTTGNIVLTAEDAAKQDGARNGNYLCISVTDTGMGISAEQMGKIFQPFFTTKGPGKGTGLGLSTCRNIIKNHDGFITVSSKLNSGTEFKIYLPAAEVEPVEKIPAKPALPPGAGERILVVDDEESILAITRAALENYGYNVLIAASGPEAVARFANHEIHLVISDLAMPFMDGRATIAALRKLRPDVPVIVASGSGQEMAELLEHIKPEAFISKPFTNETLLQTIHQVLTRKN